MTDTITGEKKLGVVARIGIPLSIVAVAAVAVAAAVHFAPDSRRSERAVPPAPDGRNWPGYSGPDQNHYSPLDQIDMASGARLGLAWYFDIDTGPSSLSAPVAADGILYFVAGQAVVHAMDAATGKLLWKYDPEVWKVAGDKLRSAWGTRGLAYDDGRVFVATMDGRLIAIDAKTGKLAWTVNTVSPGDGRYITGAPWVFDGKVTIGHGGADVAPVRGYVTTYDQKTGRQLWRFYTVPGDPAKGFENKAMEMAAKTWKGQWWKYGGGATVWNAMAYDPRFHRLYIGTGNGTPWNQKIRSPGGGDNLFVSSIVALDADTGDYVWHYQTNPGETWDYNAAMDMALTDLEIGGKTRPVLMTAPKNGFFYVIDRESGKLLSAEKITPISWATRIDMKTGRPVENPKARFPAGKAVLVTPGSAGAHSIEAMSYSPRTRLAYIPVNDQQMPYVDPPGPLDAWTFKPGGAFNPGVGFQDTGLRPRPATSALIAWDPVAQKQVWRHDLPGLRSFGGTAATAGGLVFAGDARGRFVAYDDRSGKPVWTFEAGGAVIAQPISYMAGNRQYVSVIAGARYFDAANMPGRYDYRTQRWRVLTFAVGGSAKLPVAPPSQPLAIVRDPSFKVDAARAGRGGLTYAERCMICHGINADAAGTAPSLLASSVPLDGATFKSVVIDGILRENGMPRFQVLKPDEVEDLRHFIRQRADEEAGKPQR